MGEPHVAIALMLVVLLRTAEALSSIPGYLVWPRMRGVMVILCADCIEEARALTRSPAKSDLCEKAWVTLGTT
jgi:hypothetical protein